MVTRRQFLKLTAGGASLLLASRFGLTTRAYAVPIPGGTLDPLAIPKYAMPLFIPPAMPRTGKLRVKGGKNIDYYEIAVRQFQQQILPSGSPMTTVWGYGSANHPASFNFPGCTIEAKFRSPVRVKWINALKNASNGYLSHLLPIDPTLHWANPAGGPTGRDTRPDYTGLGVPGPYTGPVPIVIHLHGGHSYDDSDGYPTAWFLPDADDIPATYARDGSTWDYFAGRFQARAAVSWNAGSSVYQYQNDQRATTLWYHDHALGMTRANVYAGLAGFYNLRGGPSDKVLDAASGLAATLPGPAPALGDAPGMAYYEIPIAIQDRAFNNDGALFYPDSRAFFDGFTGPFAGDLATPSDISPIWNPEFFGNVMVVNGRTWPYLDVEPRRYRFRFLNGCGSRFLILKLSDGTPFWQIGSDGGFLPQPVQLAQLLIGPAERADVIVDFAGFPPGTTLTLQNIGPDEPFGGGVPGTDFTVSDPGTTGQVMELRVVPLAGTDLSTPPDRLVLPQIAPLANGSVRRVSLNELSSSVVPDPADPTAMFGPRSATLGTVMTDASGLPVGMPMTFGDEPTETPTAGAGETWEIHNFTEDAHPIHIHQQMFEVVERVDAVTGVATPAESWESGPKDTVIAYPGQITRLKVTFDLRGLYVWHCHILEHEDNEMMRPLEVT